MGNLYSLTDHTSEGKSGSFIYYTPDSKLILKSIPKEQYKKVKEILKDYCVYLQKYKSNSMLPQILGLYKLKNKKLNR